MIIFDKVSKRYPSGHDALRNISFHLQAGEMAFLTGHSGAGKSTLLQLIAGMISPSGGRIVIHGKSLTQLSKRQLPYLRRSIGLIFQNPQLLMDRTIYANVAMPLVIASYRQAEIPRRVRAALDKVGLLSKEHCYPPALSTGEQQRIGIARAIVNKPALLLADEPTGNLDPALSAEIMRLFEQFNQVGVSVLVASHDLSLVASMQKRILALRQGRLLGGELR